MIYRKAPPQPGRLLLRVVAVAGAGAVLGVVACSSSSSSGQPVGGVVPNHQDAGVDSGDSGFMGATDGGGFETGGFMGATDGQVSDVLTGTVANPDGGACDEGCGLVGNPDAEADVVTGVVVNPDGGTD